MQNAPEELQQRLRQHGHDHVLMFWDRLSNESRKELVDQLATIKWKQLSELYAQRDQSFAMPKAEQIRPVAVVPHGDSDSKLHTLGERALQRGEMAVLIVAGGQGTRLGFNEPKGKFPIGPVSGKSLFQIHTEKVRALARRFGRAVPLLVMTSRATHADTVEYFEFKKRFGLAAADVYFFQQGEMPALDIKTGKLLLESESRVSTSPNGHGGTLAALSQSGLLSQLGERGIRYIHYFQVDNPLVKVADPLFIGRHVATNADVSSKVVAKRDAAERMGNFVSVDGRCTVIEYSDLPRALAEEKDEHGRLRIWAGNPAIHLFSVEFLSRVVQDRTSLPFHIARKKVPFLDAKGEIVQPDTENALKFEMFIFDNLPLAERWVLVETMRHVEFVPLKNAEGADSPSLVRQAISNEAADWLERAGVKVRRNDSGDAGVPLEISPLFALDPAELATKVTPNLKIGRQLYLNDESAE